MELQQAEGKIVLTFIRSKCFVKFFVYLLFSLTLLFTSLVSSSLLFFFPNCHWLD